MPLTKKPRSTDSFEFLASWLQQTSHFVEGRQLSTGSRRALSQRYLKAAEGLLKLQTGASAEHHSQQLGQTTANLTNNKALRRLRLSPTLSRDSCSEGASLLVHPGVEKLLAEYYQLLENTSRHNTPSAGTRYRPSVMTRLWNVLTKELPASLSLGSAMEGLNKGLNAVARTSVAGIVMLLLIWLHVLRLCVVYGAPSTVTQAVFVLGFIVLTRSQEKRNAAAAANRQRLLTLKSVAVSNGASSFDSAARPYLKCTELATTVKPLASVKWPSSLPRPSNHRQQASVGSPMSALEEPHNELDAFIKDIDDIRFAVMGASYSQAPSSPNSQSTAYVVSSVQNLCQVIGVESMGNDKHDFASIHAKLTELKAAIGI